MPLSWFAGFVFCFACLFMFFYIFLLCLFFIFCFFFLFRRFISVFSSLFLVYCLLSSLTLHCQSTLIKS